MSLIKNLTGKLVGLSIKSAKSSAKAPSRRGFCQTKEPDALLTLVCKEKK